MTVLDQIGTIFSKITQTRAPDMYKAKVIHKKDITADNLSDMLNNGSVIIGKTDIRHANQNPNLKFILGQHTLGGMLDIISAYRLTNDVLCRYDYIELKDEDQRKEEFLIISEAWKMNPSQFKTVFNEQLSGYEYIYEDEIHDIFSSNNIIDLNYEDIINHMSNKQYAVFTPDQIGKYKGIER